MKKLIIPALMICTAVGAAFATQAGKKSGPTERGYYFNGNAQIKCIQTDVMCQATYTPTVCSYFDGTTNQPLKRFVNNTQCGIQLYKPL